MTAATPSSGHDRLKATLALAARRAETIPDSHRILRKHNAAPTPGCGEEHRARRAALEDLTNTEEND